MNEDEATRLFSRAAKSLPAVGLPTTSQLIRRGKGIQQRRRYATVGSVVGAVALVVGGGLFLRPDVSATPNVVDSGVAEPPSGLTCPTSERAVMNLGGGYLADQRRAFDSAHHAADTYADPSKQETAVMVSSSDKMAIGYILRQDRTAHTQLTLEHRAEGQWTVQEIEACGDESLAPPHRGGPFEGTEDAWILAMVDCLNAAGWDAEPNRLHHGFNVPSVTLERSEEFLKVRNGCEGTIGKLPEEPPMTGEEISELYGYYVEDLTPCLTRRGYRVDDPPSRDVFVKNYYEGVWSPYLNVDPPTESEWDEINRECPQDPDDVR